MDAFTLSALLAAAVSLLGTTAALLGTRGQKDRSELRYRRKIELLRVMYTGRLEIDRAKRHPELAPLAKPAGLEEMEGEDW